MSCLDKVLQEGIKGDFSVEGFEIALEELEAGLGGTGTTW